MHKSGWLVATLGTVREALLGCRVSVVEVEEIELRDGVRCRLGFEEDMTGMMNDS